MKIDWQLFSLTTGFKMLERFVSQQLVNQEV
jgi:hypothetical protein